MQRTKELTTSTTSIARPCSPKGRCSTLKVLPRTAFRGLQTCQCLRPLLFPRILVSTTLKTWNKTTKQGNWTLQYACSVYSFREFTALLPKCWIAEPTTFTASATKEHVSFSSSTRPFSATSIRTISCLDSLQKVATTFSGSAFFVYAGAVYSYKNSTIVRVLSNNVSDSPNFISISTEAETKFFNLAN